MRFVKLLEPGGIGRLVISNRIVMPAMGTRLCGTWGEVTDSLIRWYARRARGGAGLVIVEVTASATAIDFLRASSCVLRADDLCYIPGLARLVEAIHENGAKAGIQLSAGAGAQAKGGPWLPGSQATKEIAPVSPSGVPAIGHIEKPRRLSVAEIHKIVELCGETAWNVKQAGFDMIEIHAHGGYLIAQFMSPYFNKRTDDYGGSLDNRCRLLMEILGSIRKSVGVNFPITVKYSIEDFLPGGWDIEQSRRLAVKLESAGVNGIGISSGVHEARMPAVPPYFYPPGVFVPFAEAIKEVVTIPIFVGGRLNDPRLADKVLREGKADFLYQGRALIADPDWPKKIARGETEKIRPCLACNECRQRVTRMQALRCTVNAGASRESECDEIRPAAVKKKVVVVGGGPGGMEAARIAAMRGHEVTLCERQQQLGGLMLLAGIHNEEITAFVNWLVARLDELPVEIRLRTEATPDLIKKIKPDVLIIAAGGTFVKPQVPGPRCPASMGTTSSVLRIYSTSCTATQLERAFFSVLFHCWQAG